MHHRVRHSGECIERRAMLTDKNCEPVIVRTVLPKTRVSGFASARECRS